MAIVCTLEKKKTEDRYFARSRKTGSVGFDQFSEEIASNCSVKPSDVILVLTELCDVMRHHLLAGEEIDIPGLGSFHVGVKSDSVEDSSDFNAKPTYTPSTSNFVSPHAATLSHGISPTPCLSMQRL